MKGSQFEMLLKIGNEIFVCSWENSNSMCNYCLPPRRFSPILPLIPVLGNMPSSQSHSAAEGSRPVTCDSPSVSHSATCCELALTTPPDSQSRGGRSRPCQAQGYCQAVHSGAHGHARGTTRRLTHKRNQDSCTEGKSFARPVVLLLHSSRFSS